MKKILTLCFILLMLNCGNFTYDCLKVVSIEEPSSNEKYKYKVVLKTFPANTTLLTNDKYEVGGSFGRCK